MRAIAHSYRGSPAENDVFSEAVLACISQKELISKTRRAIMMRKLELHSVSEVVVLRVA